MLGLIAAHLLCAGEEAAADHQVIENLRALVPDSIDLRALEVRAARRFGRAWSGPLFDQPPMLRVASKRSSSGALSERTSPSPFVLDVCENLLTDSPWTQWEPSTAVVYDQDHGRSEK